MIVSRNKNNHNSLMYRDPVPKNSWVFLTGGRGGARTPMQKCLWTYHRIVRFRKDILQMSQFWFTCTWLLSRCGIFLIWSDDETLKHFIIKVNKLTTTHKMASFIYQLQMMDYTFYPTYFNFSLLSLKHKILKISLIFS